MANGEFNHRLSDYIVVIRGIISREMCQQVVDLYKDIPKWDWIGGVAKVKQIWISHPDVSGWGEEYVKMDKEIFKVMSKAKDIYLETLDKKRGIVHTPNISADEGYQILHYSEGYYFKEHCDKNKAADGGRLLTCTLSISDDHDGGLFRMLRGEFDVRLSAGDAVLFPSNFLFPHEVTEITRGERHAIVTWFH